MSAPVRGYVKTCPREQGAELFSLLSAPDCCRQYCCFSNRRSRDEISICKFNFGVFTQPGSSTSFRRCPPVVRLARNCRHIAEPLQVQRRVILDRSGQRCLPVHVRFAPKADLRLGATGTRRVAVGCSPVIQAPKLGTLRIMRL